MAVEDHEVLNRSIRAQDVSWTGSEWHLSTQAFNARDFKPSVDRQMLRLNPQHSKLSEDDGVAQLLTVEVRRDIKLIQNPNDPPPNQVGYYIDVKERPIEEGNPESMPVNLAHAQIESAPQIDTASHFKKLKDALCRLAERRPWVIEPTKG